MGSLKIGLVASSNDESQLLVNLLRQSGVEIVYNIEAKDISEEHLEDESLHVWLLSVDDDSWHDAIDHLLDESDTPVYFSEPGTLAKQSHPEFWCNNLLGRLYEITDVSPQTDNTQQNSSVSESIESLDKQSERLTDVIKEQSGTETSESEHSKLNFSNTELSESNLSGVLDELEMTSIGLPEDIAAELVSELESISPVLSDSGYSNDIDNENDEKNSASEPELTNILECSVEADTFGNETDDNINHEDTIEIDFSDIESEDNDELSLDEMLVLDDSFSLDENLHDENVQNESQELSRSDTSSLNLSNSSDDKYENVISTTADEESDTAEFDFELSLDDEETSELDETLINTDDELDFQLEDISNESESVELDFLEASENSSSESVTLDTLAIVEDETAENLPKGKAQFVIDEGDEPFISETNTLDAGEDSLSESSNENESSQSFSELSLESLEGEKPLKGRAVFQIDDSDELETLQTKKTDSSSSVIKESENDDSDGFELTLEDMESEQSDWLTGSDKLPESSENQDSPEIKLEDKLESDEEFLEDFLIDDEIENNENLEAPDLQINDIELNEIDTGRSENEAEVDLDLEDAFLDDEEIISIDNSDSIPELEDLSSEMSLDPESIQNIARQAIGDGSEVNESSFSTDNQVSLDESSLEQSDETSHEDVTSESQTVENLSGHANDLSDEIIAEEFNLEDSSSSVLQDSIIESDKPVNSVAESDDTMEFEIPMLDEAAVDIEFEESQQFTLRKALTPCWVIGASLGGPAAVKRFLNCIPEDIGCSFIIAQHIDDNFLPVLAEILTNNSHFDVTIANGSNTLEPGKVFLAPLKGKIVILQDGSMLIDHSQKWSGPYSPCIDDVVESIGKVYKENSGAIIFSGMGEDGSVGAKKMREMGGQVWAQSTDTCANASMPESVIKIGETDYIGTPEELAEKLVSVLKRPRLASAQY